MSVGSTRFVGSTRSVGSTMTAVYVIVVDLHVTLVWICRVHAKHLGHPLFGDEAYGGSGGTAVKAIGAGKSLR